MCFATKIGISKRSVFEANKSGHNYNSQTIVHLFIVFFLASSDGVSDACDVLKIKN